MATFYIPGDISDGTIYVNEGDVYIFQTGASTNVQFQSASGNPTNFSVEFNETNTNGFTVQFPRKLSPDISVAGNVELTGISMDATGSDSLTMDVGDNVTINEFKGSNNEDTISIGDNFTTNKDFRLADGDDTVFVGENSDIPKLDAQAGNDTIVTKDSSLDNTNAKTVANPDGVVAGGSGDDVIGPGYLDTNYDAVDGWDGEDDIIHGLDGADTLSGGAGADVIYDDRAVAPPDPAADADIQTFTIDEGDVGGGGKVVYNISNFGNKLLANDVSVTDTTTNPITLIEFRHFGDSDGQQDVIRFDLTTFDDDFEVDLYNNRAENIFYMVGVESETHNGDGSVTYTYIGSDDALHSVTHNLRGLGWGTVS